MSTNLVQGTASLLTNILRLLSVQLTFSHHAPRRIVVSDVVEPIPAEASVTGGKAVFSSDETYGLVWLIKGTHDFIIGLTFESGKDLTVTNVE